MEKIILEKDTFENVKNMLESSDVENAVVALECIENADFLKNLVYILFLYKESNVPLLTWLNHAPKTCNKLRQLNKSYAFSYKSILNFLQKYNCDRDSYVFFAKRYADNLMKLVNLKACECIIESIEIKTLTMENKNNKEVNQNLTLELLDSLERKIRDNELTEKDLDTIEYYLNFTHPKYLTELLKDKNIFSFKDFIRERSKLENRNPHIELLVGNLLGIISYLRNNL